MLTVGRFGTRDLARATAFYDEIAALLGAKRVIERPEVVAYKGAEGGMFLIGLPFAGEASAGNGTQLSFAAPSRAVVDAVHAKALELGGTCELTITAHALREKQARRTRLFTSSST